MTCACCSGGTAAAVGNTPCPCCSGRTGSVAINTPCFHCDCGHQGDIPVPCCPVPNANCCLDPAGCDPIWLPSTMTASLSNQSFCTCVSGSFTVTWNPTDQAWEGSGSLGTCGHTYAVKLYCTGPTDPQGCGQNCKFYMDDEFDGSPVSPPACVDARTCWLGSFTCTIPFSIAFRVSGPSGCGCLGGSSGFNVVFTP